MPHYCHRALPPLPKLQKFYDSSMYIKKGMNFLKSFLLLNLFYVFLHTLMLRTETRIGLQAANKRCINIGKVVTLGDTNVTSHETMLMPLSTAKRK